jgi:hypothetical protein
MVARIRTFRHGTGRAIAYDRRRDHPRADQVQHGAADHPAPLPVKIIMRCSALRHRPAGQQRVGPGLVGAELVADVAHRARA